MSVTPAKLHTFSPSLIVQSIGCSLPPGLMAWSCGHVLLHHHDLGAGRRLDRGVTFLMVAMGVRAEKDLDVGEAEAEIGHRFLDHRHIPLIGAVDQDMPLRPWR